MAVVFEGEIRRPRTLAQLRAETGGSREEIVRVVDRFHGHGRSFVMPLEGALEDDTLVDISHESLIRQWGTLKEWVETEAAAGRTYKRLADAAARHTSGEGNPLAGRDLEVALEWRRESAPNEAWAKRYGGGFAATSDFLDESLRHHEEKQAEEKRRREELDLARDRERRAPLGRRLRR